MSTEQQQERQPCVNPECCFAGFVGFNNYCSVCFKKLAGQQSAALATGKEDKAATSKMEVDKPCTEAGKAPCASSSAGKAPCASSSPAAAAAAAEAAAAAAPLVLQEAAAAAPAAALAGDDAAASPSGRKVQKNKSKCFSCNKKTGMLGFECKCGYSFCGMHRYPEEHKCDFDYKNEGKARLAAAATKIEAQKLERL
jgi:hypothetical protein